MPSPAAASPSRPRTAVDEVADAHFDAAVAASPIEATRLGVPGFEERLDDLTPEGYARRAEIARTTLRRLDQVVPVDDVDGVTVAALRERLSLQVELYAAGHLTMDVNVIDCPLQGCREVFDLMPTETDEQWAVIATRLGRLPEALAGWATSLHHSAATGRVSARRQLLAGIDQCTKLTAEDGYFAVLLAGARAGTGDLAPAVRADLERSVTAAATAYRRLGRQLTELLPVAPDADGVGRERYRLASQYFLGARVDLEETYAWGQEELARIGEEMTRTAHRIVPGGTVAEAAAALDADPAHQVEGVEALRDWMQSKADEAVGALADVHFDIPEQVRTIECRIAPTQTGGIYYTGPSDDFTRPGRMWWSVPRGVTRFGTWSELTTVYHEGVPGHHLQVGQTVVRRELLNRWRRMMSWCSGHGEGWALYAERLMAELGFLSDPGPYLGMLDAQSLRAARVVLDIGVHCDLPAPAEVGGGRWTYEKAWRFLTTHAHQNEAILRFELDRYLGWPGQAPSYKVGERLWLDLREAVRAEEGAAFSLKGFHRRALDLGSVGLDVLRQALTGNTAATA